MSGCLPQAHDRAMTESHEWTCIPADHVKFFILLVLVDFFYYKVFFMPFPSFMSFSFIFMSVHAFVMLLHLSSVLARRPGLYVTVLADSGSDATRWAKGSGC